MKLIFPLLLAVFLYSYSTYGQINTTSSKEKVDITLTNGGKAVFL